MLMTPCLCVEQIKQRLKLSEKCFSNYCGWSRQEINVGKSNILFSKNTARADRKEVLEVLRFHEMLNDLIYLGNSLVISRNKSKEFTKLKDKVMASLNGWNNWLLSKARQSYFN